MSFRRTLLAIALGFALSGAVLVVVVAFVRGGTDWALSTARGAWYRITADRPVSALDSSLAKYDWRGLERHPPLVSELTDGQSVTLSTLGTGCFYSARYQIEIAGPMPLTATMAAMGEDEAEETPIVRTLTEEEVFRLDGAIAYYRQLHDDPHRYCTSSEEIRLEWHPSGPTESFIDRSCLLLPGNTYALSPHDLAATSTSRREP